MNNLHETISELYRVAGAVAAVAKAGEMEADRRTVAYDMCCALELIEKNLMDCAESLSDAELEGSHTPRVNADGEIELYWDDLTPVAKEAILEILGENGNFDVFPFATISVPEKAEEKSAGM